jgi:hypothetical protein
MTNTSKTDAVSERIIQIIKEEKPTNVNQLVILLQDRLDLTQDQALNTVLELQNQGKIRFEPQIAQTSLGLTSYLKTSQALWYWVTITLATLSLAVVFLIPEDLTPWSYIRNVLGAIFVLLLPGYAFIKTLFPVQVPFKLATENLDTLERIVLSVGMSIALVPLIGLVLNYTPWGVRLAPIVLSLFILTLAFATGAVVRERQSKFRTQT